MSFAGPAQSCKTTSLSDDAGDAVTGPLRGKTALVTGAGGGIGRATAIAMARAGANVVVTDLRDLAETVSGVEAAGGDAFAISADVSDAASVDDLFAALGRRYRKLDVLVHCAGVIHEVPSLTTSIQDFDRVIAVNLRGAFMVGREAIRQMLPHRNGRVVLLASDLSYVGRETFAAYVASKHAVLGLVRSWALEFAPSILVNAICPGPIGTEMLNAENMSEEWRQRELDIPLRRYGQPEEVAETAVFLAGASASFITGQGIGVNGGSVMA